MCATRPPTPRWHLRLLGTPAWRTAEGDWQTLQRKDAALLARLALLGEQPREHMAALLWPDVAQARAQANLRQRLFRLRQEVGGDLIGLAGPLRLAEDASVDLDDEAVDTPELLAALDFSAESELLEAWVQQARLQWRGRQIDRLLGRAARMSERGELAGAIGLIERALGLDSLHEHAWRRLMQAHYLRGDRAAAVAAFERCEQVLRAELGLRPGAETLALLAQVERVEPPPQRRSLPPSLLRPPRLVGRADECARMHLAWQSGQAFVLLGDAGLGKSRLLADHGLACPPGVAAVAARPGDEGVPYAVLVSLIRVVMACPALRPPDPVHELARLIPEWGPAPEGPGHDKLLAAAAEQWLDQAVAGGLHGLLIDDLQHADAASLQLLRRWLSRPLPRLGLAAREATAPAPLSRWLGAVLTDSQRAVPLRLQALDEGALVELVHSLDLPHGDQAMLIEPLSRHWGGNPLFALEMLKDWLLRGAPQGDVRLPDSVEVLLERRLGTLSPAALQLARVAAVAGADFQAEVAADVLGCALLALAQPWAELEAAQILRGGQITHESMLDALLRGLPQALRPPLHGQVAGSLSRLGAPFERIARHHACAGAWSAAAQAGLQAAQSAEQRGQRDAQLAHLRQAADWFDQAGQAQRAFDTRLLAVPLCMVCEGLAAVRLWLDTLGDAAQALGGLAPWAMERSMVAVWAGEVSPAIELARQAMACSSPDSDLHLRAQLALAVAQALGGQAGQAVDTVEPLWPRFDGVADPRLACELWGHLGVVRHYAGRMALASQAVERQIAIAQRIGHVADAASAQCNLVGQYVHVGRARDAVAIAQQARATLARLGDNLQGRTNDLNLSYALLGLGRHAEALALLSDTLDYARQTAPLSLLRHAAEEQMAEWCLSVNRPDQALAELSGLPEEQWLPQRRGLRLTLRVRAWWQAGQPALAAQAAEQAVASCGPQLPDSLRVRVQLHAALALPPEVGGPLAEQALADARRIEFLPGALLAHGRLAGLALRRSEPGPAAEQARQALVLLAQGTAHGAVNGMEMRAMAAQALDAHGDAAGAQATRHGAQRWLDEVVWPQLPAEHRGSYVAHPLYAALGLAAPV
ncbi:AAA family ATPase [Ideonella sp. 4Y11]|uniref:AAA family ATPase n=1 Tax=Ideonella aquatica TaxID=2824119 RepID=A0A941BLR5_9BURK|nr:BTAD domain-containing putative transcriptional regulator [Ideonella aquatica]MBQ0959999.1 AAA family ATPase [Ideonella aquatica]